MSQRECAGFNWPPLSIPAEDPVSICPETVNRAGPLQFSGSLIPCPTTVRPQIASVFRVKSELPAMLFPFWAGVPAIGVGHPDKVNTCSLSGFPRFCSSLSARNSSEADALTQSLAAGVAHPARAAIWPNGRPVSHGLASLAPRFASIAVGVGHPVGSVSDVRRTDARRRKRDSPEGIFHGFQVSLYKVEPRLRVLACNLLTKDFSRAALADEPGKMWPEMTRVIKPSSFACRGERLARTGTGPNRSIIWPAGAAKGERPDADSREEVALCVVLEVIWVNILDRSFVDVARCYVAGGDQVSKPLGGIWVDFVVVGS